MLRIECEAVSGVMSATLTNVPAFPGERFVIGFPEAIGDAGAAVWYGGVTPDWEPRGAGRWRSSATVEGELSYEMDVVCATDFVDVRIQLKNLSERTWAQSLAFNCFNCSEAPSVRDYECVRHWVRANGQFRRLTEIPRQFGPRPALQLYSVEGQPPGRDIPFVANFESTPKIALEGWMAIVSRDGRRLVAAVSQPALCLFQNMEYSCIHSAPSFGRVEPGHTSHALTRIYFAETTIHAWYARMRRRQEPPGDK